MTNSQFRVDQTCSITCVSNEKTITADILEFQEKNRLVVSLNKSIKMSLRWNGRLYVGQSSGLEFTSNGPKITPYRTLR